MDAGLTAALLGLAAPMLDLLEKNVVHRLTETSPVQRAAERTAAGFPEVEGCEQSMLEWCDHDSFRTLLSRFAAGDRDVLDEDEDVVNGFIAATTFYYGEDTRGKAGEVVPEFLRILTEELYSSTQGVALLAARGETIYAETANTIVQQADRTIAELKAAIGQVATNSSPPSTDADEHSVLERAISSQIDIARDLLRSGKPKSALELLKEVGRGTQDEGLAEEIRFRLALNLGTANLEVGDPPEALRHFDRALEIRPSDVDAMIMVAKTRLASDQPAAALDMAERVLREDLTNLKAFGMRLLALHDLGRDDEAEQVITESRELLEGPTGAAMLGELRLAQGRAAEAIPLLRSGLASDQVQLPLVRMLLAVALVNRVIQRNDAASQDTLDEHEQQTSLRDAEGYFTHAIEEMASLERRSSYLDALATRAGVRVMLRDLPGARADCDAVLREAPNHRLALENRGRLLLLAGDPTGTLELVEQFPPPLPPDMQLLRANALLKVERFADARDIAKDLWSAAIDDKYRLGAAELLLLAEAGLGTSGQIPDVLLQLERNWPDDPIALATRAGFAARNGDLDSAMELLNRALSLCSGGLGRQLGYDLAEVLYQREDFAGAVAAYKEAGVPDVSDPEYRNYLLTLLRAGYLGESLRLAVKARKELGITSLSELEVHILEIIGDLQGAASLLEELGAQPDCSLAVRLQLVSVRLRLGEPASAEAALSRINVDEAWNDADSLLDIAEARLMLKLPDALELAFRARRISFDSPQVHKRYLAIFLNREDVDQDLLNPTVVDVGSTVHLRRDGERLIFTILDDEDVSRSRGEISPTDELGTKLMGLSAGDLVTVGPEPTAAEYEIEKIQSKYVHAFQDTWLNFPVWFPAEPGIWRIEVRENDLSNVFLMIDEQHKAAEEVMNLYRTQPVTLGLIAELLGRSVIDVWVGLVGIRGERLFASRGADIESKTHENTLSAASRLALDLVAVMTFAHLGLLERLAAAFQVVVPQSLITELRLHIARQFEGATASGTIGKEGTQYVQAEITPQDIERGRNFMTAILEVLETHAEIVAATAALELGPGEYKRLQEILGASSADAILVAKHADVPLFSDDLRLRELALTELDVRGVWSQTVLDRLVANGTISQDEYLEALLKLSLSNYRHPKFRAEQLFELQKKKDFELTTEINALYYAAFGPEYDLGSCLSVGAELITNLSRQTLSQQRIDALIGTVVASIVLPRVNRPASLEQLAQALRVRMQLDPIGLDRLLSFLRVWAAAHHL